MLSPQSSEPDLVSDPGGGEKSDLRRPLWRVYVFLGIWLGFVGLVVLSFEMGQP